MSGFRRVTVAATFALLVSALIALPVAAQTGPYQPDGEEPPEVGDDGDEPPEVGDDGDEAPEVGDDGDDEPEVAGTALSLDPPQPQPAEVAGVQLARTGTDTLLLVLLGSLVLGAGSWLVVRSRRGSSGA